MHSKQDIENAARLVPELRIWVDTSGAAYKPWRESMHAYFWQPWAKTKDWAVLDTAVKRWWTNHPLVGSGDIEDALRAMLDADFSGDLNKRKAATFAAAVTIGAYMKGVEDV